MPYGATGLPLAFVNVRRRWTIGGRGHLVDLAREPFRYRLSIGWTRAPEHGNRYTVRLLVPRGSPGFGLLLSADLGRSADRFHGYGNDSTFEPDRLVSIRLARSY